MSAVFRDYVTWFMETRFAFILEQIEGLDVNLLICISENLCATNESYFNFLCIHLL